jgi:hypothetical protein
VALGSNSLTVPSNSSNSSLAIDPRLGGFNGAVPSHRKGEKSRQDSN